MFVHIFFLPGMWVRYFRKPLQGPLTHGVPKPPQQQRKKFQKPRKPDYPQGKRSFPKSKRSFPKSKR